MNIRTDLRSPNFTNTDIPVEFVLLHYTAGDLDRALAIFSDPSREVSCHVLISRAGEVIELVECLSGRTVQAAHAGMSTYDDGDRIWSAFNKFSIGIELENVNGNIFEFTNAQYESLARVFEILKAAYPSIRSPHRVLGHEHVAGSRGKADPGLKFCWDRFFEMAYPESPAPVRLPLCPPQFAVALAKFSTVSVDLTRDQAVSLWHAVSAATEAALAIMCQKTSPERPPDLLR